MSKAQPYILIWSDYDCTTIERFDLQAELEKRATEILTRTNSYGTQIDWSGYATAEYSFEPFTKTTSYRVKR